MARSGNLFGKNVVITGANSGIGLSLLRQFNRMGCNIMAADIDCGHVGSLSLDGVHTMEVDLSNKEGVDSLFESAASILGRIDIFIANAGFPYYEVIDSPDWEHIERIYRINTISPIYSYERMLEQLQGEHGSFVITCSAMGETAMPGFTIYGSTKYAIDGFQAGIRFECPKNMKVTTVYPVSTDTGFFRHSGMEGMEKPFPVQTADRVASCIVSGISKGKAKVYPSRMYSVARILFLIVPPIRWAYCGHYRRKMKRHFDR